jgi:2-iminobutanoate/2-iminopropanoate deaminase
MKKLILLTAIALLSAAQGTFAAPIERAEVDSNIGYAEVVRAGDYVYISGNVGWGKMPDAVKIAYDSLDKLLKAHGLTFKDVVKENIYATDIDALKASNALRNTYYGGVYPAATWVQVNRLFNPDIVIEVELVAYAPQGCCPKK